MIQHREHRAAAGLTFPIKLRCGSIEDLIAEARLESALTRALGRAFTRARRALPDGIAIGSGVNLTRPKFTGRVTNDAQTAQLESRVWRAIKAAANNQHLLLAPQHGVRSVSRGRQGAISGLRAAPIAGTVEQFDPARFDAAGARYDVPSYQGGRAGIKTVATVDVFAPLKDAVETASKALRELLRATDSLKQPTAARQQLRKRIAAYVSVIEQYGRAVQLVSDVEHGKLHNDDVPQDMAVAYNKVIEDLYENNRIFRTARLQRQVELKTNAALIVNIIRARVSDLDREANDADTSDDGILQQTWVEIGDKFLDLVFVGQPETQHRLAFLLLFYSSPVRAHGYALARFANEKMAEWWNRLHLASKTLEDYFETPMFPRSISDPPLILGQNNFQKNRAWRQGSDIFQALMRAIDRAQKLNNQVSRIGDPPGTLADASYPLEDNFTIMLAAEITQLRVETPILELWAGVVSMKKFFELQRFDYEEFIPRFDTLEKALAGELALADHTGIETRFNTWRDTTKTLLDDLVSSARRQGIERAIISAIPALLAAPIAAELAGVWVAEAVSTARWVIVIARAAAVSAVFQALGPGPAPGQSVAVSIGEQFTINLLTEGFGAIFRNYADVAEASSGMRRALLKVVTSRPAAFISTTALVTAAQVIEAKVDGQHGETDLTALLTVNLVINGLCTMITMAAKWPPKTPGRALITASELVEFNESQGIKIDPDIAGKMIKLAALSEASAVPLRRIQFEAKLDVLTPERFDAYVRQSEECYRAMQELLPGVPEALGLPVSSSTMLDWIAARIAYIRSVPFSAVKPRVYALPERTPGLVQLQSGDTWAFDREHPPSTEAMDALQKTYTDRGNKIIALPGGGWEATKGPDGPTVIQVLPAAGQIKGLLPPAIEDVGGPDLKDVSRGAQFQVGLLRLKSQTIAPALKSRLSDFLSSGDGTIEVRERLVSRILQILGRPDFKATDGAWRGLNRFLYLEGDKAVLARVMQHVGDSNGTLANAVLEKFATFDADAVRGLETVYKIRPRTTAQQLFSLFEDFPTELTVDIFRTINTLAPRSVGLSQVLGRLMSGDLGANATSVVSIHQRGALGELSRGFVLANENPGKPIGFGIEVRTVDPISGEVLLRIVDVAVLDPAATTSHAAIAQEQIAYAEESKEISSGHLGRGTPRQLAKDIVNDALSRKKTGAPRYKSFGWAVRSWELEGIARTRLMSSGKQYITAEDISAEMRNMIKDQLRPAFQQRFLKNFLSADEIAEYQKEFEDGIPFLVFH